MRSRGLMILLIAVLAGLAAMYMASRWLLSQAPKIHRIAVAAKDVGLGAVLTPESIRLVDWPEANTPKGAVIDPKKLNGRVIKASLVAGEVILESRLAPEGTRGGLASLLAPGKRAMAVRVNEVVGVSGFALPGTFVDVLLNTTEERKPGVAGAAAGPDQKISKIVLERMLVLAIAQEVERDATKPKVVGTVTLEVTPEQAEKLDVARSVGSLSLVLRNQNETAAAASDGATKAELFGRVKAEPAPAPVIVRQVAAPVAPVVTATAAVAPAPATPAPPPRPTDCIEVIRGMNRTTECF